MRKLLTVILTWFGANVFFWFKPEYKKTLKIIIFSILTILAIFYFHNEYVNWSKLSKTNIDPSYSYLVKNVLVIFVIIVSYFSIKNSTNKNDGYDKFRKDVSDDLSKQIIKNYKTTDSINETEEEYFNYFKNKKKLRNLSDIKFKNDKN